MTTLRRLPLEGALWSAQAIVAFTFSWVGSARALVPLKDLEKMVPWIDAVARQVPVRAVGAVELVLALGLLVPAGTRFLPWLTPLCALGLAVFAGAGFVAHAMYGAWGAAFGAFVLTALSLFIAWGRSFKAVIPAMPLGDEDPSHAPYPDLAPDHWD